MRDRDTIPSQILIKQKARPQRFQAIQAAAKRKLRYAAQATEKRSTPLNATQMNPERCWIQRPGQRSKLAFAAADFKTVGHQEQSRDNISCGNFPGVSFEVGSRAALGFAEAHPLPRKEAA